MPTTKAHNSVDDSSKLQLQSTTQQNNEEQTSNPQTLTRKIYYSSMTSQITEQLHRET